MSDEITKTEELIAVPVEKAVEKVVETSKKKAESGKKKKSKKKNPWIQRFTGFAGGTLLGLILGVGGCIGLYLYNPPDVEPEGPQVDVTVLQGRIEKASDLTSAKEGYTIAQKVTDTNRLFDLVDLPWTKNSFILVYEGSVHAGVKLDKAKVELDGNEVLVYMPAAEILVNAADASSYKVLDERDNILNPIHVEDVTNYLSTSQLAAEKAAAEGEVLAEAQKNAEDIVRALIESGLPKGYTVRFVYE